MNKVQAPSLILEDYNYFINKAISQYINKVYNLYDVNQQKTDDIRVLKSSTILKPSINNDYGSSSLFSKIYEVNLPDDYLHILNCVVEYTVSKAYKCYNAGDLVHFGAKKLTADMWSQVINNYYMRPQYKNPYYYINNVNVIDTFPTTDTQTDVLGLAKTVTSISGDLSEGIYKIQTGVSDYSYYRTTSTITEVIESTNCVISGGDTTDLTITRTSGSFITDGVVIGSLLVLSNTNIGIVKSVTASTVTLYVHNSFTDVNISSYSLYNGLNKISYTDSVSEKLSTERYGNKSKVRLEIRYGKDNSLFILSSIYIDYRKSPQFIRLTQDQIDEVEDNSQTIEFPDYVCQEIVNELVKLLMENASDPRLQTNIPINQTIANPVQGQTPQQHR